ncbi:PD-(D/E)XK nuclease-like domain-containing protein [Streptomyces sp. NPDC092296]|uniref:PD-(D/E)XK nuclease-like domain-containing protein n=1 Tax=Streptomyces sp. NPDC092296 TaxID=3366012 RepID=UPI00381A7A64
MTTTAPPLPATLSETGKATSPGVYDGMPAEIYHADPVPGGSLSSTGARRLLPPSCPALLKWDLDHPQAPRKEFDLGTAAHRLVLGDGPELVRIDADEWRSNAVKAEVAAARAAGAVPLKPAEYEQVHAMAAAIRRHPLAAALFAEGSGKPEQSLFWRDERTGVNCRARLDWLGEPTGGRLILPDFKSARSASRKAFERSVLDYRYDQQADWYSKGVRALGLAEDVAFVFVVQEKTPPYLINVIELSSMWLLMAEDRNRRALETYQRCTETGVWPGYSDDVEMVTPPSWLETEHEREYR